MNAAAILAAKRALVAECRRLSIPIRRVSWPSTIDLAVPKWGTYSVRLWADYRVKFAELAGAPIPTLGPTPTDAVRWLTRPIGERAALVMAGWGLARWDENPPGSNRVPELAAVAKHLRLSAWYQAMGWSWCDYSAHLAGLVVGSVACASGVGPTHAYNGLYTVESLEVADAGRYGWRPVPKTGVSLGCKGWIDFGGGVASAVDHTFWILGRPGERAFGYTPDRGSVVTAEGNTSGEGEPGSQANGGRFAIRVRPLALIAGAATPTR